MGLSILFGCNNTIRTNELVSDPTKETFTINSGDKDSILQIDTTIDGNQFRIDAITIIDKDVTLNTINEIVGYYDSATIASDTTIAIVNYYGRKWTDFLLLDTRNGALLFYEPFHFSDVISAYQYNNNKMNYDMNENGLIKLSCYQIIDEDSLQISYQVYDNEGYLQSGNFKYIISENKIYELIQNEPELGG